VLFRSEAGKTGYDMASGINARKSLKMETGPEVQAEARLRAALLAQGGMLRFAVPQVVQDRGFVMGAYASPQELERARRATRNIKGLRETVLCMYPAGSGRDAVATDGELRDAILRLSGVQTKALRVHVVEGNAVLLGVARTQAERQLVLDSAREAGAKSVRDYLLIASR
jgi:osmotically-inducible protein OsmY